MTEDKTKASNRSRQSAFKERMRSAGYEYKTFWVHKEDVARVQKYLNRLRKQ